MISDALLLRSVDYRDADRIVTLFTREAGKLSAVARGARSSKRRFAGSLEPYAVIRVELDAPRGDLHGLKRAEVTRAFPNILSDLARMESAGAALALVREAHPPHVVDESLFFTAVQYLTVVDHEGDPQRSLLLGFALRVLSLVGLSPRLEVCGRSGERVPRERPAYFDPAVGAVVARRFGGGPFLFSAALRARLIHMQSEEWLAITRREWAEDELKLARAAVSAFMQSHFSQELASRLFPSASSSGCSP